MNNWALQGILGQCATDECGVHH